MPVLLHKFQGLALLFLVVFSQVQDPSDPTVVVTAVVACATIIVAVAIDVNTGVVRKTAVTAASMH